MDSHGAQRAMTQVPVIQPPFCASTSHNSSNIIGPHVWAFTFKCCKEAPITPYFTHHDAVLGQPPQYTEMTPSLPSTWYNAYGKATRLSNSEGYFATSPSALCVQSPNEIAQHVCVKCSLNPSSVAIDLNYCFTCHAVQRPLHIYQYSEDVAPWRLRRRTNSSRSVK